MGFVLVSLYFSMFFSYYYYLSVCLFIVSHGGVSIFSVYEFDCPSVMFRPSFTNWYTIGTRKLLNPDIASNLNTWIKATIVYRCSKFINRLKKKIRVTNYYWGKRIQYKRNIPTQQKHHIKNIILWTTKKKTIIERTTRSLNKNQSKSTNARQKRIMNKEKATWILIKTSGKFMCFGKVLV